MGDHGITISRKSSLPISRSSVAGQEPQHTRNVLLLTGLLALLALGALVQGFQSWKLFGACSEPGIINLQVYNLRFSRIEVQYPSFVGRIHYIFIKHNSVFHGENVC